METTKTSIAKIIIRRICGTSGGSPHVKLAGSSGNPVKTVSDHSFHQQANRGGTHKSNLNQDFTYG
jgi:hypothetical protein